MPADAEVFFDGEATMQKGGERLFVSPLLTVGKTYHYEVNARYKEGDKPVDHKRRVDVTGGGMVRVDFTKPETPIAENKTKLTEEEALQIATDAYVYGYPLVTMEMTRRVMTNAEEPKDNHAPMGQFYNAQTYPNASFRDITAPNADTLYSTAWLDVSREPYVLSIPDEGDRYYLMPMLDAYTNVFQVPGKRTTGDKAQTYAITGPGWKGKLPEGVKEYKSPTSMVWILGRTYCTGTPEDYKAVHEIQDKYKLVPLSAYGKEYTPPKGKVDPAIDMKTAVREQVNKMDAASYFKLMAALMKDNPPAKEDAPIVEKMAKIGIVPGQDFDASKLDPAVAKGLEKAPKPGVEKIAAHMKDAGKNVNGWVFPRTGRRVRRPTTSSARPSPTSGWAATVPQDAVYPTSEADRRRQALQRGEQLHDDFRQGADAARGWLLVADHVRRGLLLRGQPAEPLHAQPAERVEAERGRLGDAVPAE